MDYRDRLQHRHGHSIHWQQDQHQTLCCPPPTLLNSHVQFNVNLLSWEQLCVGGQKSAVWPLTLTRSDWQYKKKKIHPDSTLWREEKGKNNYTLFLLSEHFQGNCLRWSSIMQLSPQVIGNEDPFEGIINQEDLISSSSCIMQSSLIICILRKRLMSALSCCEFPKASYSIRAPYHCGETSS